MRPLGQLWRLPARIFLVVLVLAMLFAMAPMVNTPRAAAATAPWWSASYNHRVGITVQANDALTSGYSVSVTLDHAALVTASNSLASGNDVRIVRYDGVTSTELDRVLDLSSSWNNANTKLWFKTQAAVAAATADTSYYLYYGNAAAGTPPANADNVYLQFDDFNNAAYNGTVNGAKWQTLGTAAPDNFTVAQSGGVLVMSGTTNSTNPYNGAEIKSQTTIPRGYAVESTFAINSQNASASSNWEGVFGVASPDIAVKNQGSGVRTNYWNGSTWVDIGPSSMTSSTFAGKRVLVTIDGSGTAKQYEDGVLMASRVGASTTANYADFRYAPDVYGGGGSFNVSWDDIVIRQFVNNEPITILDKNSDVTATMRVSPELTVTLSSHAGACNGVSQTAGTSANGTTVNLGRVSAITNSVAAQDVRVTTNGTGGYTTYIRSTAALSDGFGHSIPDFASTNLAPAVFSAVGVSNLGYTTNHALSSAGSGTSRFQTNKWAGLSTANAEVAYSATGPADETTCVGYQVGAAPTQVAGTYATTVYYTVVPVF